jgi:hypothetical protein
MLLCLGIALALLAPHGLWMLEARFDFVQFLADKQRSEAAQPYLVDAVAGLGAIAASALGFLVPFALVFSVVFRHAFGATAASPWAKAAPLIVAFSLGILVLDVLVLRATQFEQRYMMCALIAVPLAGFLNLDPRKVSEGALRSFAVAASAIALFVFAALAGRALLSHRSCNRCWEEMPFEALVHDMRASGFRGGTIVADHYNVAANVRLAFPASRTYAANYYVEQPAYEGQGQCLLVWNARNAGDALPVALADYLAWRGLARPGEAPRYVDAPIRRSRDRMDRFAYQVVTQADANCRPR